MKHQISNYLKYSITAKDEYSIHSPFLFELYNQTISYPKEFYDFEFLKRIRLSFQKDNTLIQILDLGAGSNANKKSVENRKIKDIAKRSLKTQKECEFIFKLINHLQPQKSLELGTSLGLTSLYIAKASKSNTTFTIEGCPNLFNLAKLLASQNNIPNINYHNGNINEILDSVLTTMGKVDFAFLDANHTYKATTEYFDKILKYSDENTVILIDDIYWSTEMTTAWNEIISRDEVRFSIDFFKFGLIFLRKSLPKQHFTLKI